MHEVLVNRLGGLSLPRKSVVRLTDRPDMTLAEKYHLKCMPCLPFSFSDEQFDQNGEKSLGLGVKN